MVRTLAVTIPQGPLSPRSRPNVAHSSVATARRFSDSPRPPASRQATPSGSAARRTRTTWRLAGFSLSSRSTATTRAFPRSLPLAAPTRDAPTGLHQPKTQLMLYKAARGLSVILTLFTSFSLAQGGEGLRPGLLSALPLLGQARARNCDNNAAAHLCAPAVPLPFLKPQA